MRELADTDRWPELPYSAWPDTCARLQLNSGRQSTLTARAGSDALIDDGRTESNFGPAIGPSGPTDSRGRLPSRGSRRRREPSSIVKGVRRWREQLLAPAAAQDPGKIRRPRAVAEELARTDETVKHLPRQAIFIVTRAVVGTVARRAPRTRSCCWIRSSKTSWYAWSNLSLPEQGPGAVSGQARLRGLPRGPISP